MNLAQRRRQVALDFINLHIALGAGHNVHRHDVEVVDTSIPAEGSAVLAKQD